MTSNCRPSRPKVEGRAVAAGHPGQRVSDALGVLETWAASPSNPASATETPSEREALWLVRQSAFHRLKSIKGVPVRVHPSLLL